MKRVIAIITAAIAASISSFTPAIASTQQTSQYVLESARRNGVNMGGWDANILAYGSKVFCEGMDLGRQTPERYTASMAQRMAADGTNPREEAAFGEWLAESVMLGSVLYTALSILLL